MEKILLDQYWTNVDQELTKDCLQTDLRRDSLDS